jgi:hypothetical protein
MIHQAIVRFIWDSIVLGGIASCFAVVIMIFWRPPERTVDDAIDYLVPVDLDRAEGLLDAAAEGHLRSRVSVAEFRSIQRRRMHLYLEILRRMAHNSAVLIQLGNRHAESGDVETIERARGLQDEGIRVRLYALAASAKIRTWLLLDRTHVLPSPVLCDIKEVCGIQGVEVYEKLKTAASMFFVGAMPSKLEQLLEHL